MQDWENKRGDESFSLEDIIAEVKGGGTQRSPAAVASRPPAQEGQGKRLKEPEAEGEREAPPARSNIREIPPEMARPSGKRLREIDEEARGEVIRLWEAAPPDKRPPPPMDRRPAPPPRPPEPEEEEDEPPRRGARRLFRKKPPYELEEEEETGPFYLEEEEEEHERPRRAVPYDFISLPRDDAAQGYIECTSKVRILALKLAAMLVLTAAAVFLSIAPTLHIQLPFSFTYIEKPYAYVLTLCVLEGICILLSGDIVIPGLWRFFRLRPTLDTLTTFSALCTLAHGISIVAVPTWGGYLPYCGVGCLTLLFATLAKRQRAEGLRRTYKAVQVSATPSAVKAVQLGSKRSMAYKTKDGAYCDIRDLSALDDAERSGQYFAPFAMVSAIAAAVIASFGKGHGETFLFALAAISSVSAPAALLISASTVFQRISKKLVSSGTTLISPEAAGTLARSGSILLADSDIFPTGSVKITGMKVMSRFKMEDVVCAMASIAMEIGGGMSRAFGEFASQQYIPVREAEDVQFYEGGGVSAKVGTDLVMVGTISFLMRMGVRVTEGLKVKNGMFVAINSVFAGVFTVKYGVLPQTYYAFRTLRHVRVKPILLSRDFNVTPATVEARFELKGDWVEYPPEERRGMLESGDFDPDGEPLALLARDGMSTAAEAVAASCKLKRAVRFNLVCGYLCSLAGMLLMFFLSAEMNAAAATPYNVMAYLILWFVPVWSRSLLAGKF